LFGAMVIIPLHVELPQTPSALPFHLIHSYSLIATSSITTTSSLSKYPPNLEPKKLLT